MSAAVERFLEVRRLARTKYEEAYSLQKDLVEARAEGRTGDAYDRGINRRITTPEAVGSATLPAVAVLCINC